MRGEGVTVYRVRVTVYTKGESRDKCQQVTDAAPFYCIVV